MLQVEPLVVLVVVEEDLVPLVQEILHHILHHKVILVVQPSSLEGTPLEVVEVALVLLVQMVLLLMVVMVVQEHPTFMDMGLLHQ